MQCPPTVTRLRSTAPQQAAATAAPVIVFTTPGCKYCRRAKEALKELQVDFQEVDVSTSSRLRAALSDAAGQRTVPQVFAGGRLVGGSDALLARIADGSFASTMQEQQQQQLPQALQAALQEAAAADGKQQQQPSGNPATRLPPDLQQLLAALSDRASGVSRASSQPGAPLCDAFTGQALLEWLAQHNGSSGSREDAAASARALLAANAITLVADTLPALARVTDVDAAASTHYRLRSDAPRALAWGAPLNAAYWWGASAARPAGEVAEELRGRILALYDAHLSSDGRAVDYGAMRADPAFWEYVDATAELQRVDLAPLSRHQLAAFAINTYNALVIHTLVVHGPERYRSTLGRKEFFSKAARYVIAGASYTLDDLENGILRGNQPGAASLGMLLKLPWLSKRTFAPGDGRAQHVVSPVDPRIHFALVCGAKSCPPIKLYSAVSLDEGLAGAAEAFCASEVAVDVGARTVTLNKIFDWYYCDFGATKAARLAFLLPYLPPATRRALAGLLQADPEARGIKVAFRPYDWSLNAAG